MTVGKLRVPLHHLTPTPSTLQSPPGAVRLAEPPPPPSRLAKRSQSEPPTWRGISHGAGHAAGVPIDRGFLCVCSLLNLSADPASGRRDPGATGELQSFAGTEPARLGGFSTRCADSTSVRGAEEWAWGVRGESTRPGSVLSCRRRLRKTAAPRRLPPWPHAGHRSPRSLCPHSWGLWTQGAPAPGPNLVGGLPLCGGRRCRWTR